MSLALVLGGGGVAGVAWHTGVLAGLVRAGADPTGAELLIGTSAGATVAAQVGCGLDPEALVARQLDPDALGTERVPPVTIAQLLVRLGPIYSSVRDPGERRRLLGAMALDTETVPEDVRRAVMAGRLVDRPWPDRPLWIPVVDAVTGDRRVLDRGSGVDLVDAVAASSAVPGVWPPVTFDGSRWIDGGVWSLANADLAAGHDRVLVLAPVLDPAVAHDLAALGAGVRTEVVAPDAASLEAFGPDVLDPATRGPSARAGLAQGAAEAARVGALLAG